MIFRKNVFYFSAGQNMSVIKFSIVINQQFYSGVVSITTSLDKDATMVTWSLITLDSILCLLLPSPDTFLITKLSPLLLKVVKMKPKLYVQYKCCIPLLVEVSFHPGVVATGSSPAHSQGGADWEGGGEGRAEEFIYYYAGMLVCLWFVCLSLCFGGLYQHF